MLFLLFVAAASEPASSAPIELSRAELTKTELKLQTIETMFVEQEPGARAWFWTWVGVFSAAAVVQGGLGIWAAETGNTTLRNAQIAGAITDLVGLVAHTVIPFTPAFSSWRFRTSKLSGKEKLEWAEARLEKDAEIVSLGRSWLPHVFGAALGLASGLTLLIAFHQPVDALLSFLAVTAVAEIRTWTLPTRARKNSEAYKQRYDSPQFTLLAVPMGVGMRLVF